MRFSPSWLSFIYRIVCCVREFSHMADLLQTFLQLKLDTKWYRSRFVTRRQIVTIKSATLYRVHVLYASSRRCQPGRVVGCTCTDQRLSSRLQVYNAQRMRTISDVNCTGHSWRHRDRLVWAQLKKYILEMLSLCVDFCKPYSHIRRGKYFSKKSARCEHSLSCVHTGLICRYEANRNDKWNAII